MSGEAILYKANELFDEAAALQRKILTVRHSPWTTGPCSDGLVTDVNG
jgi:hypothetical protein